MEYLTQDVEPTSCVDDDDTTTSESSTSREKIASLFINDKEYPLSMEANIIGRNPNFCQVVLNEMTVSSKHANIKLLKTGHFIMDLGSRNKTKLNTTVLERNTPHKIKDEDWVQFGDVFAVFRLNHDDDLPMTQCNRSYKEPSREQGDGCFKIPDSKLIKPSKRTSAIGNVSSSEKDNVVWKSPKKSSSLVDSFHFDIHSLETQDPISDKITSMSNTEVQAEEPVLKTIGNKQVLVKNSGVFDAETQAFVNEDDELPSSQFRNKKSYNNDTSIIKNNSILGSSCIVPETDEDDDLTDCEDGIENDFNTTKTNETTKYSIQDDIPTQVICNQSIKNINQQYSEEMVPSKIRSVTTKTPKDLELGFIDIFDEESGKSNNNLMMKKKGDDNINDVETQIVEVLADDAPTKIFKTNKQINSSMCINNRKKSIMVSPHKGENFYLATQDILNDLCSQREMSTDTDKKEESQNPSVSSDVDATPKKVKPTSMHIELPDSEEIGSSISLIRKTVVTDNLSDSDNEDNNTEENTPILFKKERIKKNLTEKFDIPPRVITRVRKPTPKFKNNAEVENIVRSNALFEQRDQMNVEIIHENLSRLRTYENRNSKAKLSNESETIETSIITSKRPKRDTKKNVLSQNRNTEKPSEKRRNSNSSKVHSEKNVAKSSRNHKETANEENEVRQRGRQKKCDVVDSDKELQKNSRHKKDTREKKTPEKGIRRSSRVKREKPEPEPKPKSIFKKNTEQSTVSNSLESPKSLKRQADNNETRLSPKRPRSAINAPARSIRTYYVVFSNLTNPEIEKKLKSLGAVMVADVKDCTVMVSPNIKRTVKFLCAVGLGRPIVGIDWVQACANANAIVDPRLYPLKDKEGEKKFDFDLLKTINGPRGFLKGYNVSSTPNTLPEPALIKQIVECSGGRWKENGPNWICVSTLADKSMWPNLKRKGATIVSTAVLLTGALKQQVDINKHILF